MGPEEERSFDADDPVGRYWLHNSVGFGVRGLRTGRGVVREVTDGPDGVAVLAVHRGVLRGTAHVSAARVDSVDPWDETLVLRSRAGEARARRAEQARGAADVLVVAARGAALAAVFAARAMLLAAAAFVHAHGPGVRERAARYSHTLALLVHAYSVEFVRACRAQRDAFATWNDARRRGTWGDEAPLTRAGADEVDARAEEEVSR